MQLRRFVGIALVCALIGLAGTVRSQEGSKPQAGEKYALLVGVRQYDPNELRGLPYSEPDVMELAEVLKGAGYRQVVTLTQTEGNSNFRFSPTGANIRTTLKGMLSDRGPEDTILVGFAGHGVQFRDSAETYFCPMDTRLADRSTLVALGEVYKDLEACGAGVKVLLVDACRNDPQSDNSRSRSVVRLESVTRPQQARPPGGVAALFSCSPGERAFEHERLKHGVFYHFVIQGLRGEADIDHDGMVDVEELARFAKRNVPDFVKEEYGFDVRQMPVLRGEIGGLAALVGKRAEKESMPRSGQPAAGLELASRSPEHPAAPGAPQGITNKIGMKLMPIPAGGFRMGSPDSDKDANDTEKPQHWVQLSRPFYLGATEITIGQFRRVKEKAGLVTEAERIAGGNGWDESTKTLEQNERFIWSETGFPQTDDHPVVNVSWNDAIAFCNALSKIDGLKQYYNMGDGVETGMEGYRLPTEAEWEYAARGGTTTRPTNGGDPKAQVTVGNIFDATTREKIPAWRDAEVTVPRDGYAFTAPVGKFRANAFGLYDMHGNVEEWCWDGYAGDYRDATDFVDPTGPLKFDGSRVTRGGSWISTPKFARSASRGAWVQHLRNVFVGFRVARFQSSQ